MLVFCNRTPAYKPGAAHRADTMHVKVGPVLRDTIALPLFFPGKLAAAAELKLGFKTGGIIREIDAVEGTNVAAGTRIALLDTIEFTARRDKAQTALEKASRDLARAERLYSDSVATLEQLQNARSARRAARADLDIASFNISQAILVAPVRGKILKRLAEKSEVAGSGMPVVIFASTDGNWIIKASIPDRDLPLIAIGDRATAAFDAIPQKEFSATLVRIAGAAHPVTGTFEIDLALESRHRTFRPGLIAAVRLYPQQQRKMAFIPASSLVDANGECGRVFALAANDSIAAVTVTIARLFGNLLAISGGLDGIDSVVTSGAAYIDLDTRNVKIDRN